MVKIKDNVDFKELEKFGFEATMNEYYYCLIANGTNYFWVDVGTRILNYTTDYDYTDAVDVDVIVDVYNKLNDAGLVEKVEEV